MLTPLEPLTYTRLFKPNKLFATATDFFAACREALIEAYGFPTWTQVNGSTKLTATCSQRLVATAPCRFLFAATRVDGRWKIDAGESRWGHNHVGLGGLGGDAGEMEVKDEEGAPSESDSEGESMGTQLSSLALRLILYDDPNLAWRTLSTIRAPRRRSRILALQTVSTLTPKNRRKQATRTKKPAIQDQSSLPRTLAPRRRPGPPRKR